MKGIILAGGSGTRLYPITQATCKQLLPVYDKPMIYYPISTLMLTGIKDIMIITTREDQASFVKLLGDGSELGISFTYAIQDQPKGIAEAFLIAENFIGKDRVALILGDNIFYSAGLSEILEIATRYDKGAFMLGYYVRDPRPFGVVEFDENRKVISLEEKPEHPKSHYVVPGLYFYDHEVVDIAKQLEPSPRGELEITDLNNEYLKRGTLKVLPTPRGMAWLDTGTCQTLTDAANFVEAIQKRQGLYIACLEEIAYRKGFISKDKLLLRAKTLIKTEYGQYLMAIVEGL